MADKTVTVRMQVTVEFDVGRWAEGDMTFSNLRQAAIRDGEDILNNRMSSTELKIVGKPFVRAIMVEG